jgi:hypothetical protein
VTDYSDVAFFKLWVYGDGAIAGMHPVMLFTLEDESQNRIWAHMRACLKASAWSCYFLELTPGPSDGSAGPFWQDQWDAGGDCDITKIQKVGLFTQGSVTPESYSFACIVDNIVQGFRTTGPTPTPNPPGYTAAGPGWTVYE